jgi:hypothetical protein
LRSWGQQRARACCRALRVRVAHPAVLRCPSGTQPGIVLRACVRACVRAGHAPAFHCTHAHTRHTTRRWCCWASTPRRASGPWWTTLRRAAWSRARCRSCCCSTRASLSTRWPAVGVGGAVRCAWRWAFVLGGGGACGGAAAALTHCGARSPPPHPPPPHTHTTHATHTTPPRARATHTHTPRARRAGVPRGRHPDQGRCAHPGGRAAPAKRHQGDRRQLLQVGRGVLRRRAWRAACGARARTHARVGLGAERGTSRAVGDGQLWRLALWCCGSCCCLTRCLPPAAHARTPHNTHHAHHTHHTPRTPHTPHTRTNTQWLQSPVSPLPPTQLPA